MLGEDAMEGAMDGMEGLEGPECMREMDGTGVFEKGARKRTRAHKGEHGWMRESKLQVTQ